MCGRKGPGARTRGRRRHPRKLGGTPPRSPGGARAAEETAYPLALRMPRGSRWGRWGEGVLTKPKPQAARYPAGCPPLSAAKCGEAEEACPNVWRGYGGGTPPEPTGKGARGRVSRYPGERERGEPISARYPAGVAGSRDPAAPISGGVAPAGRAATPRAPARRGAPTLSAVPSPLDGGWKREHNGCAGQRGLLAPRYPARGAGRCRGAVSAAILRRAPRSGRVESVTASMNQKVALATAVIETQNAAALSPAAILPPCAASVGSPSGEARLRCRVPRRYPAAAAPVRVSRPPRPLSCGRGGRRTSLRVVLTG